MHDNILSMGASDVEPRVELSELGGSPDLRGDNILVDGQQCTAPLGVELTGFRLLTSIVILIGVPMAVYSYNGHALVSTTLDLFGGTIFAFILFWLGVIEATRPGSCPLFFQVDLAPPILRFLCRPEVHLWFLSVLPVISDTAQLRAMLDARRDEHASKDGLDLAVLAFSTTVCIFCLQCVRVVWPKGFEGTILHSPFTLSAVMWLAHYVCLVVKFTRPGTDYPTPFSITLWISCIMVMCMSHFILLLVGCRRLTKTGVGFERGEADGVHRDSKKDSVRDVNLDMGLHMIFVETTLIKSRGGSPLPEDLYAIYAISFSCYVVFTLSNQSFTSIATVLTSVLSGFRRCMEYIK